MKRSVTPARRETVCVLGISGSLRSESYSTSILKTVMKLLLPSVELNVRTLEDIPLYNQDLDTEPALSVVAGFRKAMTESDGVVIATPEYNHGMPGVLKNTLDGASRPAFSSCFVNKPVLIVSSSPGPVGGARAQYQVRETLVSMLARIVPGREITVGNVASRAAQGELIDARNLAYITDGLDRLCQEHCNFRRVAA